MVNIRPTKIPAASLFTDLYSPSLDHHIGLYGFALFLTCKLTSRCPGEDPTPAKEEDEGEVEGTANAELPGRRSGVEGRGTRVIEVMGADSSGRVTSIWSLSLEGG